MSLLESLNIKYILSITRLEDMPDFSSKDHAESYAPDIEHQLVRKQIDINDDPTEDILCHLKDACDWIEVSLLSTPVKIDNDKSNEARVGVLVHCTQGIFRSGSIIIAYRKCNPTNLVRNFLMYVSPMDIASSINFASLCSDAQLLTGLFRR